MTAIADLLSKPQIPDTGLSIDPKFACNPKPHGEAITDLNGLAAIISLIRRKNSVHLQDIDNTGSANLSDSTRLLSFRDTSVLQQRDCRVPQRMKSLDRGTSVSHPGLCFYIEACIRQGSNLQPMFFIYVLCY